MESSEINSERLDFAFGKLLEQYRQIIQPFRTFLLHYCSSCGIQFVFELLN